MVTFHRKLNMTLSLQADEWFSVLQPPKKGKGKKGKGKGKKKTKTPTVIEGISTEEMSKEQVRGQKIFSFRFDE